MFQPVGGDVKFDALEAEVGRFWKERQIYEKSLAARAGAESFVFYEGPPTANGMPHPGHCLGRAIKDLFPRYRTMRGYRCERKAGWDTHGLPVEVEVCKELGIHSKEEIEEYGVEPFIHRCQENVWRYMREWERMTERIGFWIHLDEAYVTYHQSYVESVWWALANFFERGLLYKGHKIVWWWAQGGTALSAGEVGQGYREVADPSVYVKFPLLDEDGNKTDTSLLVWTTTPWTLPSNQFVAVKKTIGYSTVKDSITGDKFIIADDSREILEKKLKRELHKIEGTDIEGSKLIGRRYVPPFYYYYESFGDVKHKLIDDPGGGYREAYYFTFDSPDDPRPVATEDYVAWKVVPASFVTTESGTGIVHQAPAFGEVDYDVLLKEQDEFVDDEGPELINCVGPDGKFTDEGPDYCRGRWVKDCDKDIIRDLKSRGLLYHQEQYLHEYPFCWRADQDPLIQYPRESWFIRTTQFKEQMLANNREINWLPDHIRDGRFGNFLETNVDWALSRERYWGTPLPIWVCEETGYREAISSYAELLAKPGATGTEVWDAAKKKKPELPDDLKVHKPYIDAITYDSPKSPGKRMRRVPEVIDCWFDSGAMPFAQWGYPQTGKDRFAEQFPADFISEGLDQTRGWFYSQLAISTLLFSGENDPNSEVQNPKPPLPHPFRNCIVSGLILAEWWESPDGKERYLTEEEARAEHSGKAVRKVGKMSKQLRNYPPPQEIFDTYGADALRWFFFANQAPWNSIIYSERAIKDSIPEFLLRLWNVYSFFVIYANIDGFDPASELSGDVGQLTSDDLKAAKSRRPVSDRSELDRWIESELNRMAAEVTKRMDAYDNYGACQDIIQFVDALSNWYVRRSRDRFWSDDKQSTDKVDAYWTLYECLLTTSKVIAPFVPFLAENLWQNLAGVFEGRAIESVHLCDFPTGDADRIDEALSERMSLVREITSLGRGARMAESLKVRQPLSKVEVILANEDHREWLESHAALIAEELNVKQVEFTREADPYITYAVMPDFKRLGPRLGKQMPAVKKALGEANCGAILTDIKRDGHFTLKLADSTVTLDGDDIQVRLQAKPGWAAAQGWQCVVVLATELTESLVREGKANDVVRAIQDRRKEIGCEFTDRIALGLVTESAELRTAIDQFSDYIKKETLTTSLGYEALDKSEPCRVKIGSDELLIYLSVQSPS